jgi:hypothetical protein
MSEQPTATLRPLLLGRADESWQRRALVSDPLLAAIRRL